MLKRWLRRASSLIVFLLLWEFLPRAGLIDPLLVPPLSRILARGVALLADGVLLAHAWASLWRVFIGFALASGVAVPAGIVLGLIPGLEEYTDLLVQMLRPLAPPAWIPLAILWFGIGNRPAVFIIFVGTVFAMFTGVLSAAKSVDKRLVKTGLTLGATPRQVVFHVVLPSLAPAIFAQLRIGLGLAWMCVIASEMVAVRRGLGFMMMEARNLFRTEDIFLGMMVVGILGLSLDSILRLIERRALRWQRGLRAYELFGNSGRP